MLRIVLSALLVLSAKFAVVFTVGPRTSELLDGKDEVVYLAIARAYRQCGTRDFMRCAPRVLQSGNVDPAASPASFAVLKGDAFHLAYGWILEYAALPPALVAMVFDFLCIVLGLVCLEKLFSLLFGDPRVARIAAPIVLFLPVQQVLSPSVRDLLVLFGLSSFDTFVTWERVIYAPTILVATRTQIGLGLFFAGELLLVGAVRRCGCRAAWGVLFGALCGALAYISPFAFIALAGHSGVALLGAVALARARLRALFGWSASAAGVLAVSTLPIAWSLLSTFDHSAPPLYDAHRIGPVLPLEESLLLVVTLVFAIRRGRFELARWAISLFIFDLLLLNVSSIFGIALEAWHIPVQFVMPLLLGTAFGTVVARLGERVSGRLMEFTEAISLCMVLVTTPLQVMIGDYRDEYDRHELYEYLSKRTPPDDLIAIQPQGFFLSVEERELERWNRQLLFPVEVSLFGERKVLHQLVYEYCEVENCELFSRLERLQLYLFTGGFDHPQRFFEESCAAKDFLHNPLYAEARRCVGLALRFRVPMPASGVCELLRLDAPGTLVRESAFPFAPPPALAPALSRSWVSPGGTWEVYRIDWRRFLELSGCSEPGAASETRRAPSP